MKTALTAAAIVLAATVPAFAQDYNISVTNLMPAGNAVAPLIVLDAARAEPFMFTDGQISDDYRNTILEGDPRPLNGKIGDGVAGPVLGTSGPPGVLIDGGETAAADMFIFANTLRFYAKGRYGEGEDKVISGVYDLSTGPGTMLLNLYDIGHSEGTNEVTLVQEGVLEVVITRN